jgi:anti-sigma B factor antagonist
MSASEPVIAGIPEEWPPFDVSEAPLAGGAVVTVVGELDLETAPELRERLTAIVAGGATAVVVDLRRVTFMDSVGLAAVLLARRRLPAGGRFALVVAPESYAQLVLEIAALPKTLACFEERDAAIAHVAASGR